MANQSDIIVKEKANIENYLKAFDNQIKQEYGKLLINLNELIKVNCEEQLRNQSIEIQQKDVSNYDYIETELKQIKESIFIKNENIKEISKKIENNLKENEFQSLEEQLKS